MLNDQYWTKRYLNNETGWDAGNVTLPIMQYLDQIRDKSLRVLIPGAGNAYEAAYTNSIGFSNVHILDFSPVPIENFIKENPNFPMSQIHCEDFFDHKNKYDLILEQTFFCALLPDQRENYVKKMKSLLNPGGKLVGVLFNKDFSKVGPPFGASIEEYQSYFGSTFHIQVLEPCYNSIAPRHGSELFIILINK
ncbi:methyltransferase domain-containing protein [Litoribacter populi]|uniref:methyltransferase domain-containing protein n=1 Tax=Litoribacter populi TaxID=2598460 RepID=UPI002938D886|nr:methyltransferase domain-containing protein [Litoribacter populi]